MKVDELIAKLEKNGLEIYRKNNEQQISLYYLDDIVGNKFLEIHYSQDDEITRVKFHTDTVFPTYLACVEENSGDDDYSITRQVRAENYSDEDIIMIAVASYDAVEKKYQLKYKK
ncbi:hypothetical protein [Streptococcus cristatus]|uniref:Uncharacterized protein n=1 Tax=Streptococcus cristatus TaxID=45634 RepID=A0A139MYF1_STRCR|nr:hypothetical protein [Streptococcus cristatus]KXT68743.1 hypothetical protein SCRDD08_01769 [Streptococcus cristatus]